MILQYYDKEKKVTICLEVEYVWLTPENGRKVYVRDNKDEIRVTDFNHK